MKPGDVWGPYRFDPRKFTHIDVRGGYVLVDHQMCVHYFEPTRKVAHWGFSLSEDGPSDGVGVAPGEEGSPMRFGGPAPALILRDGTPGPDDAPWYLSSYGNVRRWQFNAGRIS